MATRPTDDQFAYVLTPSEPPPASSSQKISGGASASHDNGGASASRDNGGASASRDNGGVTPDAGSGGCTVCHMSAAFDPTVGQISITLPEGDAPAIRSATVTTRSDTRTQQYDVDAAAMRSLLLTGRVDWYLPAGAFKPTSVVVAFRLEGEDDDAPTHDLTAL